MLLKGKTAVVTGCSRGIGRSIVDLFAENGANIFACYRRRSDEIDNRIKQLSRKYSITITPVYFDLSQEDEIKAGMKEILAAKCDIDILVNNAGMIPENSLFTMTTIASMRQIFEVNFFAQIMITQYIVRAMMKRKQGTIINLSSIAALDGDPGQLEYVASKAALLGATKKLSRELADWHIRVNAVAPGITRTDMVSGMSEEMMRKSLSKSAIAEPAEPLDVAHTVLFLACHMSKHITGQVLRVDGGC